MYHSFIRPIDLTFSGDIYTDQSVLRTDGNERVLSIP